MESSTFINYRNLIVLTKGIKNAREKQIDRILTLCTKLGAEEIYNKILKSSYLESHDNFTEKQRVLASIYSKLKCEKIRRQSLRDHHANPCYTDGNPIVLKRGVSWKELLSIFDKGKVTGRLNIWHTHDKRRSVLWADQYASDGVLLSQANDLDRQACIALCTQLKFAATRIRQSRSDLDPDVYKAKQEWIHQEETARAQSVWTSAVITTTPIKGAYVYPKHNHANLMGINEYSLPSGAITLELIKEIKIYKERDLLFVGTPEQAQEFCFRNSPPQQIKSKMQGSFAQEGWEDSNYGIKM